MDHGKRVLVRLPTGLHEQLVVRAEEQGVSVNTLVIALLAGAIGWTLDGGNT